MRVEDGDVENEAGEVEEDNVKEDDEKDDNVDVALSSRVLATACNLCNH